MVWKIIAARAVLGLEMTDYWLDGSAPPHAHFRAHSRQYFGSSTMKFA
jgi:hypothetical protein